MMWQAETTNQPTEEILWLTTSQVRSPSKRAAVGRKKKPMGLKRAVAAGLCSTPAGGMERAITFTLIGAGSRAGVAAR